MDRKKLFFSNADLRKLILPLVVDQFLQAFVGLADSVMVSSVGEAAVSGVSLIDTVMVLIINIFTALATGGAVIAGQFSPASSWARKGQKWPARPPTSFWLLLLKLLWQ